MNAPPSLRESGWTFLLVTLEPAKGMQLFCLTDDPEARRDVAAYCPAVIAEQAALLPAIYGTRPKGGFGATPASAESVVTR